MAIRLPRRVSLTVPMLDNAFKASLVTLESPWKALSVEEWELLNEIQMQILLKVVQTQPKIYQTSNIA